MCKCQFLQDPSEDLHTIITEIEKKPKSEFNQIKLNTLKSEEKILKHITKDFTPPKNVSKLKDNEIKPDWIDQKIPDLGIFKYLF